VKGPLVVATHSSDIMKGFLEGTKSALQNPGNPHES
jgi:hypothetical protein